MLPFEEDPDGGGFHIYRRAVEPKEATLREWRGLARDEADRPPFHVGVFLRRDDVVDAFPDQLTRVGRAEQTQGGRICEHDLHVANHENRIGRVFDQQSVAGFALPQSHLSQLALAHFGAKAFLILPEAADHLHARHARSHRHQNRQADQDLPQVSRGLNLPGSRRGILCLLLFLDPEHSPDGCLIPIIKRNLHREGGRSRFRYFLSIAQGKHLRGRLEVALPRLADRVVEDLLGGAVHEVGVAEQRLAIHLLQARKDFFVSRSPGGIGRGEVTEDGGLLRTQVFAHLAGERGRLRGGRPHRSIEFADGAQAKERFGRDGRENRAEQGKAQNECVREGEGPGRNPRCGWILQILILPHVSYPCVVYPPRAQAQDRPVILSEVEGSSAPHPALASRQLRIIFARPFSR